MTPPLTDEQIARVVLAAVSEPGDGVTGTLLRSLGASETVQLIKTRKPLPDAIDNTDGALWRDRLRARLRDADVDRVLADTERRGFTIITPDDSRWPTQLRELGVHAPIALWIAGNCSAIAAHTPQRVAIVGARAATSYGEHVATELASALAGSGMSVVSGGAYGIDGAAHRAAISAHPAATVAVLAGGLDVHIRPATRICSTASLRAAAARSVSYLPAQHRPIGVSCNAIGSWPRSPERPLWLKPARDLVRWTSRLEPTRSDDLSVQCPARSRAPRAQDATDSCASASQPSSPTPTRSVSCSNQRHRVLSARSITRRSPPAADER